MKATDPMSRVPEHLRPRVAKAQNAVIKMRAITAEQREHSAYVKSQLYSLYASGLKMNHIATLVGLSFDRVKQLLDKAPMRPKNQKG